MLRYYTKLMLCSILIFIFSHTIYAVNDSKIINLTSEKSIQISPSIASDLNFWCQIDKVMYVVKIKQVQISPTKLTIFSESGETEFELSSIQYFKLLVGETAKEDFNDLRKISSFNQELEYKEPQIINSHITINGTCIERMIDEIFVIKDFVIIQKEPSILYFYPYKGVENWSVDTVEGSPKDVLRDFLNDINSKNQERILKWFTAGTGDSVMNAFNVDNLEYVDVSATPLASRNLIAGIVTAWDKQKKEFVDCLVILKLRDTKWIVVELVFDD